MKILAIGGSGWIGSAFTRRALAAGHDVTVVSRGTRPIPDGARHIRLDRNDQEAWSSQVMRGHVFLDGGEGVLHAPDVDFTVDFMGRGMKHGVQMLAIDGWGKPNLYVSSDIVYSPRQAAYPLGELDSRYQTRFEGGRLYEMEWLFTSGSSQRFTNTLRPGYVYGPGRPLGPIAPHRDDPDLLTTIVESDELALADGGIWLLQPLYLDDLVEIILDLAERPDLRATKFNVPGPELVEARAFYTGLARALGTSIRIEDARMETTHTQEEQYARHRILSADAIQRAGLPVPSTRLRDGLARTLGGP